MDPRIEAIIAFWFQGPDERGVEPDAFWFGNDPLRDREIADRFGASCEAAVSGELDAWGGSAEGRLALVLLIDQFRRNIHRGTPQAFSADPIALSLCMEALETGGDRALEPIRRVFLYMPMQHAEDRAVQARSVETFAALAAEVSEAERPRYEGFHRFAVLHRDIVERFGRFPHRNRILGREDTPEEAEYLAADAPSFGQG